MRLKAAPGQFSAGNSNRSLQANRLQLAYG